MLYALATYFGRSIVRCAPDRTRMPGRGRWSADVTSTGPSSTESATRFVHSMRRQAPRWHQSGSSVGQDCRVTPDHFEQDEAKRLVLGRIAAAPDVWRGRATSAGAFLSAAAAASLLGLSQRVDGLNVVSAPSAVVAAVLYVVAVCCFMLASVWPAKKSEEEFVEDVASRLYEDARTEVAPIKRFVLLGAWLATGAIVSTAVCGISLASTSQATSAWVTLRDDQSLTTLTSLCPDLEVPFRAEIVKQDGVAELSLDAQACGNSGGVLILPEDDIAILKDHP